MKKIPLNVLDEYAKILTPKQANKLYESKNHKEFKKTLNEALATDKYSLYLDAFTIADELNQTNTQFACQMNEDHKELMDNVYYKIDESGIMFKTRNQKLYDQLLETIANYGVDKDILDEIKTN